MNMTKVSDVLRRSRYLKYVLVVAAGVALVGFVGENSILGHINNKQKIAELQEEIDYYQSQYERDMDKLRRLDTDPKAIVEIAREHYFMKNEDEDIFVLSDDRRTTTNDYNETAE